MRAICVICFKPFGADIDPRLFAPPNNSCSLDEAKAFAVMPGCLLTTGA